MAFEERIKNVTQLNDATGWLSSTYRNPSGQLNMSVDVDSTWSGSIVLERTADKGVTADVVCTWTDDQEAAIDDRVQGVWYRLRCSVYSSGTAALRIWK